LSEIEAETCDQLCKEFASVPLQDAAMGIDGDVFSHNHRNTSVRFIAKNHWFEQAVTQVAAIANAECKWNYEIDENEAIQFAEYGASQHYNWHTDTFALSGEDKDRKLTAVCLLNDPSEFEGGEFQVRLYSDYIAPLKKGTIIVFPSILEHKVNPVISGFRKTATVWFKGPRFK